MEEKKTGRGGARAGAGRKKGTKNSVKRENTRTEIVYLRMTADQKAALRKSAEEASMKMSDYILSRLF